MSEPDYEAIRRRIKQRYDKRFEFYSHLLAFLLANGAVWVTWLLTDPAARMSPILLILGSVGWFIGLAIHGMDYTLFESRERAIERAIEAERQRFALGSEKPKRHSHSRLTEDGELVEVIDEEWDDAPQARRR